MNSAIAVESDSAAAGSRPGTRAPLMAACVVAGLLLLVAAVRMVRRHHRENPHRPRRY